MPLLVLLAACLHSPAMIAPSDRPLPTRYVDVGPAGTRLCQAQLFSFIPVEPKYTTTDLVAAALAPHKGDALIQIRVDASQYYWLLGTTRCHSIEGTAVRW